VKNSWCPDHDSTLVLRIDKRHLHQSDRYLLLPFHLSVSKLASRSLPPWLSRHIPATAARVRGAVLKAAPVGFILVCRAAK
jgi:hypothetical protein